MGDSPDQGRPAKRIKLAPPSQPLHSQQHLRQQRLLRPAPSDMLVPPAAASLAPTTFVHVVPSARRRRNRTHSRGGGRAAASGAEVVRPADAVNTVLETGSSPASTASPSSLVSSTSSATLHEPVPEHMHLMTAAELEMAAMEMAFGPPEMTPLPAEFDLSPIGQDSFDLAASFEQQPHLPWDLFTSSPYDPPQPSPPPAEHQPLRRRPQQKPHGFLSPFRDCLESFGKLPSLRFPRPTDGRVNSYIKFNWPQRKTQGGRSSSVSVATRPNDTDADEVEDITRQPAQPCSSLVASNHRSTNITFEVTPQAMARLQQQWQRKYDRSFSFSGTASSSVRPHLSAQSSSASHGWVNHPSQGAPRLLPAHFGLVSKMDKMDRQLFEFCTLKVSNLVKFFIFLSSSLYCHAVETPMLFDLRVLTVGGNTDIGNWCPGRSVLGKTNLWLHDFAAMEGSEGVLAAIQSLAGIYVYDYQPLEGINKRINYRFSQAESRLSQLLAKPTLSDDEASELITIFSILSMQDIVLIERRRKRPHVPRWLEGFKQGAYFLETIDEGARFWSKSNVQLSSLRISQSIIVGRAVILSQLMTNLPSPDDFDPEEETGRFGWLLYGDVRDMYEIHGGCGFSKKLLHALSQITYCAARLKQCPESPVIPLTAKFLFSELLDMRQWSSAPRSRPWELARDMPQTVEWVRAVPQRYVINDPTEMTEVTAEAWRIAAIIYLQCRAMRLPRNHPDVVANLADLAKCIEIMPTSGSIFTAQAPLFPVFLLGMLATVDRHVIVAQTWFENVTSTPVRSSVPPLYEALKRIWSWIDHEPSLMLWDDDELEEQVGHRDPWWEHLVARVLESEDQILCLT
ncbi:zinc finger protein [Trichoderma arundinaceum]|uniref:Zinc finger protein n=1 Tax=Trichoderma arundinaceum TaxID=490622 RepID=A0A395NT02_TRIAR|nr:zinc finger protein [Trichoderma arundinaceum]